MRYFTSGLLLFCFALIAVSAHAQSWGVVGILGFSGAEADYESMALDTSGTPYVVYQDYANSFKATVKKFNGSSWVTVGIAGFSGDVANFTSIAVNRSGTPYVVFQDGANSQRATVMKYNGINWIPVGTPGISPGIVGYTRIAIDTGGLPYIAYQDDSFPFGPGPLTVMKFDGVSWLHVGSPSFTSGVQSLDLAISGRTPYVVYRDSSSGLAATVVKFNGSSWVTVGIPGFSAGGVAGVSIAMHVDTPCVTYTDNANSQKATAMKYNGSGWVNIGTPGFSAGIADYTTIAVDASGTPFVAYSDGNTVNHYATVMKFNGTTWVNVGSPGFSGTLSNFTNIGLDKLGTPYVCYQGFTGGQKASVMKLLPPSTGLSLTMNTAATLNISPNPCHGVFTIKVAAAQNEDATVVITNMLGRKVTELTVQTNKETDVLLHVPPGMYFISAVIANERLGAKIVVE